MPRAYAILLLCTLASCLQHAAGQYYDMSEGDPGMETPCPSGSAPFVGTWTEEDASLYPAPPEGPLEGKVLKSQYRTKSCIRTPQFFEVEADAKFQLYVYLPATTGLKITLLVWLVEEDDSSYLLAELNGTTEAKWHLVQADMPNEPGIIFPSLYKVRFFTLIIFYINKINMFLCTQNLIIVRFLSYKTRGNDCVAL